MSENEMSAYPPIPCKHLRSKEMYYESLGQDQDEFSSGLFWCTRTHENFGPDGEPAQNRTCCPGRSCYID